MGEEDVGGSVCARAAVVVGSQVASEASSGEQEGKGGGGGKGGEKEGKKDCEEDSEMEASCTHSGCLRSIAATLNLGKDCGVKNPTRIW